MSTVINLTAKELTGAGTVTLGQSVATGNACLVFLYAQTASNIFTVSGLGGTWESLGSTTPAGATHMEAWLCRNTGTTNVVTVAGGGTTPLLAQCWLIDEVDQHLAAEIAFASGSSAATVDAPVLTGAVSNLTVSAMARGASGDTIPAVISATSYYEAHPGTGAYLIYAGNKTESDGPEIRGYYYPYQFWTTSGTYTEEEVYLSAASVWSAITVSLVDASPPYSDPIANAGWMLIRPDGTVDVDDSITGPLRNATLEAGEPQPNGSLTSHTVWAAFQAPVFGDWTFTATTTEGFQLSLALYSGPAAATDFGSMTLLDSDDGSGGNPSVLLNDAPPGAWYYLQIGTPAVPSGSLGTYNVHGVGPTPSAPSNDNFADAILVDVGTVAVSTYGATNETGEPRHLTVNQSVYLANTVWYKAVSSGSGEYTISCNGMVDDIEVGVYTGAGLTGLTLVTDTYEGFSGDNSFTVTPGTTFYLQVASWATDSTDPGYVGYGAITLARIFGPSDLDISTADNILEEVPGQLIVTVGNGGPDAEIDFSIDGGATLCTATLDDFGSLYRYAILIPSLTVGNHVLSATSGSASGSLQFTVLSVAGGDITTPPDTDPGTQSIVTRWQLDDPTDASQYVFPRNPQTMQPLFEPETTYTVDGTSAHAGQSHTWEGAPKGAEWAFSGLVYTMAELNTLKSWVDKEYRMFLHDHLGRVWKLYLTGVEATPKRALAYPEMQEYTVSALILKRVS